MTRMIAGLINEWPVCWFQSELLQTMSDQAQEACSLELTASFKYNNNQREMFSMSSNNALNSLFENTHNFVRNQLPPHGAPQICHCSCSSEVVRNRKVGAF